MWHGMKRMLVNRMLDPLCDLELWPWLWPFKVEFWNSCIAWMWWPIDMERKGFELLGCWTHYMTLTFHLIHALELGFSRSNFQIYSHISGISWDEKKGMWVGYNVGSTICNLELGPQPTWTSHPIFGFSKSCILKRVIPGMNGPIDIKQKEY